MNLTSRTLVYIISTLFVTLSLVGSLVMLRTYNVSQKYTIENMATEALGVRVTIGELHSNADQGTVRIGHVQIFNPKGFSDGAAIEIENIDVTLEEASRGLIRISEIAGSNMQVNLEVRKNKNNLGAITEKIKHIKPLSNPTDTEKLKVMVDQVSVVDNRVRPRSLMVAKRTTVPVQNLQFSQIGYMEKGMYLKPAIVQAWSLLIPHFLAVSQQSGFLEGMGPEAYEKEVESLEESHHGSEESEDKESTHGDEFLIGE